MSRHFRPLGLFGPIFWGLVIGGVVHLFGGNGVLIGLFVLVFLALILNFVQLARLLELMD
jgi:hypothetical protein